MQGAGEGRKLGLTEAVHRIDEALAEEGSLRVRTEGLTWILWGLVTAGTVLTFDAVAFAWGIHEPWFTLLWVPWIVLGAAVTSVLWRSAALSRPGLDEHRQGGVLVSAAYVAFILAVWFPVLWLFPELTSDTIAVLSIGTAWTFFGATNPFNVTATGRRVMTLQGVVILLAGVLLAATLPSDAGAANRASTLVNLLVSAGVPILGGAWQATRG